MEFTNSGLVTYKNLTKNKTNGRNGQKIDTITIHCVVGQCTAKSCCDYFATTDRECSSNYVVGRDGSIGLSVEEKNRSWCTSSSYNDRRAVTIEVASDTTHPYAVTDKAYEALIVLVADICKRNGIEKLVWSTNKDDRVNHKNGCNMTVHRDYANKSCPGEYLYDRHGEIAERVNAILYQDNGNGTFEETEPVKPLETIKVGDLVEIVGSVYYDGKKKIPAWVKKQKWFVRSVKDDRVVIDKNEAGTNSICSPVKDTDLKVCVVGGINTPEEEKPAETAPVTSYKVGDKVRLKQGACVYNEKTKYHSWVYKTDLFVRSVSGDRIVVSTFQTGPVTGPVHKNDLIKI